MRSNRPRSVNLPRWVFALLWGAALPCAVAAQTSPRTDADVERCLTDGEIVKKVETLVGITNPLRYVIECDGQEHDAVFKRVDESRRGVTRFGDGGHEFQFTDSYKYERAAYLLDRELSMGRVPVAVLRRVRGKEGALVQWIDGAVHEMQFPRKLSTEEIIDLASQKTVMHLFDALIYNTDRRPENWLVGAEDLNLYLIDHSRAFRWQKELPEEYLKRPARLSRGLFEALKGLEESRLQELLEGLISQPQIQSLLARRDLIVEKITKDVEEQGEEVIFSD